MFFIGNNLRIFVLNDAFIFIYIFICIIFGLRLLSLFLLFKKKDCFIIDQATPNTTQTLTLTEGIDSLFLQTIATSNPASNFTYHFNNSVITSGHVLAEYVNSSSNSATVQTSILSSATVDSTNGGFYHIYTCNFVGCKTDEWKVIVKCKIMLFL